jgi:flagellar biosynthetic protein FliR
MDQLVPKFSVFLLIFVRVASFFVTMPLFSYRTIPAVHRLGISFVLSWIMYYTMNAAPIAIDGAYFLLILKESLIGLLIGFTASLMMTAIQVAGALIDFQMGFTIANVIDPHTGVQSPLMGQYFYMFALLFLLSVDGHHLLLDGIYYSYQLIPLEHGAFSLGKGSLAEFMIHAFQSMFVIAFQMAVPVVASLFLVDVALGIIARTVPQMNIFVVGFPVKIITAFIVMIVVMSAIFVVVQHLFDMMLYAMRDVMKIIGGT